MTPPTPPRPLADHTHGDPDDPCLEVCYTIARDRAAHRLAEALDVPVELLTGIPDVAHWTDHVPYPDRPRYRALASRRYDHDPGTCSPEDPDHLGHLPWCHTGFELEVAYAVSGVVLGITRAPSPLDPAYARVVICDWLRTRAEPLPLGVTTADVDLYLEVPFP